MEKQSAGQIVIPRWMQLAGLPALLLIAWFTIGLIGEALFIFLSAILIALILNPLVCLLRRAHIPRPVGVFVVYGAFVAVIWTVAVLVLPPAARQLDNLLRALPGLVEGARGSLDSLQLVANRAHLKIDVYAEARSVADSLSRSLPAATRSLVGIGVSLVRAVTITIIIVVISIYMLLDARRISLFVRAHFPTHSPDDAETFIRLTQKAVVEYVQAQLLLSTALGLSAGGAMWFLGMIGAFPSGAKYAVFFGAWTAVMELIPYIGPVMGAVPPTVVALFHSSLAALWVIIAFVIIQEVEGHILAPLIMGNRFRVHPLLVIFAILAGNQIHGVTGMFLAIPLIPLGKELITFFASRVTFARWSDPVQVVESLTESESPPEEASARKNQQGETPPRSS